MEQKRKPRAAAQHGAPKSVRSGRLDNSEFSAASNISQVVTQLARRYRLSTLHAGVVVQLAGIGGRAA
jgi:hypothetical protein